jgi:hypothetical protein
MPLTSVEYTLFESDSIVSKPNIKLIITYTLVEKLKDIIVQRMDATDNINSASKVISDWNNLPPAWNN